MTSEEAAKIMLPKEAMMAQLVRNQMKENAEATTGLLYTPMGAILHTLERPWKNNETSVSCIPVGNYVATLYPSEKFKGEYYRLHETKPRTYILIHPGNYVHETNGCILLGMGCGYDEHGIPCVWSSRKAVSQFMRELQGQKLFLSITNEE